MDEDNYVSRSDGFITVQNNRWKRILAVLFGIVIVGAIVLVVVAITISPQTPQPQKNEKTLSINSTGELASNTTSSRLEELIEDAVMSNDDLRWIKSNVTQPNGPSSGVHWSNKNSSAPRNGSAERSSSSILLDGHSSDAISAVGFETTKFQNIRSRSTIVPATNSTDSRVSLITAQPNTTPPEKMYQDLSLNNGNVLVSALPPSQSMPIIHTSPNGTSTMTSTTKSSTHHLSTYLTASGGAVTTNSWLNLHTTQTTANRDRLYHHSWPSRSHHRPRHRLNQRYLERLRSRITPMEPRRTTTPTTTTFSTPRGSFTRRTTTPTTTTFSTPRRSFNSLREFFKRLQRNFRNRLSDSLQIPI